MLRRERRKTLRWTHSKVPKASLTLPACQNLVAVTFSSPAQEIRAQRGLSEHLIAMRVRLTECICAVAAYLSSSVRICNGERL